MGLVALISFSCKKDNRFECVNGTCEISSNGAYTSLEDCQNNCKITRYSCVDGSCELSATGDYRSLEDCQAICETSAPEKYDCISGNCILAENGENSSLSECQQNFSDDTLTQEPMSVVTISANPTSGTSAELIAEVTSFGSEDQVIFGFCLSTNPFPTLANSVYQDTGFQFTGQFNHEVINLNPGTGYYVRAYIFNSQEVKYGAKIDFTTNAGACQGETTKSWVNATYQLVEIGNQCWFKENLKLENYAFIDGYSLDLVVGQNNWVNTLTPAYTQMNDTGVHASTFGNLYNFYAVEHGDGEICPTGWHIPTKLDFEELITELGGPTVAGGKLKSTDFNHWDAPNSSASNSSDFTAVGSGYRYQNGVFNEFKETNGIWSSTVDSLIGGGVDIYYLHLSSQSGSALIYKYQDKRNGLSVRCIKD